LKGKCPDCSAEIEVADDSIEGEIVVCPDCGLELEVKKIGTGKIELRQITIEREDWGE
jgi:alpha-aminoadipate carrier protein LysW